MIPEQLPPSSIADGVFHALDERSMRVKQIGNALTTAFLFFFLFIGLIVALFVASLVVWAMLLLAVAWLLGFFFFAWLSYHWPKIQHKHMSYKLDAQGMEIHRGVLWRSRIHVPRSRVQHTDVSQGPLERSFGLGSLVIYTAGVEHAMIHLHGLEHGKALGIRDYLLPQENNDAV